MSPSASGEARLTAVRAVLWLADAVAAWASRQLVASPSGGPRLGARQLTSAGLRELAQDGEQRRIINDVFAAGARRVGEVMVPRTEVRFVDAGLSIAAAVAQLRGAGHSRFPAVDGGPDEVVGFVHLRDLLLSEHGDGGVAELVRHITRLPASKPVLAALSELRRDGQQLALVVDEYGGTAGIVTLEDLIEELVGEIRDEYDPAPEPPLPVGALPAEVDGRLNLADFAQLTGVSLNPGPYETVAGYLMARLGRVPAVGDEVPLPGAHRLVVAAVDGRRVSRVALSAQVPVARTG
jgi:putative hemolysin